MVRRVQKQVHYQLDATAQSGDLNAKHLNNHYACSSVCIDVEPQAAPDIAGLASFLFHLNSSTGPRVQRLSLYCRSPERNVCTLGTPAVQTIGRALPSLRTLEIHATLGGSGELYTCLAAGCPLLTSLKLRLPGFAPESVAGLSALRGLTRLELSEDDQELRQVICRPGALLHQLSSLTALTHLGLGFAGPGNCSEEHDAHSVSDIVTGLEHLSLLRSLELTGECFLRMEDFGVLARALPTLEQLRCSDVYGYAQDRWDGSEQGAWHMPKLATIEAVDYGLVSPLTVLHLSTNCPVLQRLVGVTASLELHRADWDELEACASSELLRWAQGLGPLLARGLLAGAELFFANADEAGVMCAALEQLPTSACCTVLAGSIHALQARALDDWTVLGRLAACLPGLRDIECPCSQLLTLAALAPLHDLHRVAVFGGCSTAWLHQALARFAVKRLETIGADAAASRVFVRVVFPSSTSDDGVEFMRAYVQGGAWQPV